MHFPGCPYIEYIQNNNILWGFSCPTTHLPRPFLIFFHFFKKYTFTITMVTIRCFMCQGVLIPRPVSLPYEPRMFYDIRVNFAQHAHDSLVSTFAQSSQSSTMLIILLSYRLYTSQLSSVYFAQHIICIAKYASKTMGTAAERGSAY